MIHIIYIYKKTLIKETKEILSITANSTSNKSCQVLY